MAVNLTKRADKGAPINIEEYDEVVQAVIDLSSDFSTHADAWLIGGMQVRAYASNAPILDQLVSNAGKTVTLNSADGTYGREDAVVIDIQGEISVLQGTPGAVVIGPTINPETHYLIRRLLIPANATSPVDPTTGTGSSVVKTWYAEFGTEAGGESDVSSSYGTIDVLSETSPLSDTKSIEATDVEKLHYFQFDFSTDQNSKGGSYIEFELQFKAAAQKSRYWFLRFYKDEYPVETFVFKHNQHGLDATSTDKQYISIPTDELADVAFDFDSVEMFFYHSKNTFAGYWVDNFKMVDGLSDPPSVPPTIPSSTKQQFPATAGQTEFILSDTPDNVDVWVDHVYQIEGVDYTYVSGVLTMIHPQDLGSIISVRKY